MDLLDTTSADAAVLSPIYVGAVLGASVHAERYQSSFVHFVKSNGVWLQGIPTAVFSVSLAAASNDENVRHEANVLLSKLLKDGGMRPVVSRSIPGALLYTQCNFF